MDINLCDVGKGLEELFRYAYWFNISLDDDFDCDYQLIDNLNISEIQEMLRELVVSLLDFKSQRKLTDKAELVLRNEQFEGLLRKLENELRSHVSVENQLKLHIENYENEIEDFEKAEKSEKKNSKKKIFEKKNFKNLEAEKIRKEMEEKIIELSELSEKKEKALHKTEFENIKLRNLLEEKSKECENIKKEIIKLSKAPSKREITSSGLENIKRIADISKIHQSVRDLNMPRISIIKSVDEPQSADMVEKKPRVFKAEKKMYQSKSERSTSRSLYDQFKK